MKDFLNFINEAVGVPDNLIETAEIVYDGLMKELEKLNNYFKINCESISGNVIRLNDNFSIGNKKLSEIEIVLNVNTVGKSRMSNNLRDWLGEIEDTEKRNIIKNWAGEVILGKITEKEFSRKVNELSPVEIEISMANLYMVDFTTVGKRFRMKNEIDESKTRIAIYFELREKTEFSELFKNLQRRRSFLISGIAHELKHFFDRMSQKDVKPGKHIDYYSLNLKFDSSLFPIYDFIYKLYYFHDIENSVRPSELLAQLKADGITKSNFREYFFKSSIWDQIKDARELDYNTIKGEIKELYEEEMDAYFLERSSKRKNYTDTVDEILKSDDIYSAIEEVENSKLVTTPSEKLDLKLEIIFEAIDRKLNTPQILEFKVDTLLEIVWQTLIYAKTKELSDNLDLTAADPLAMRGTPKEKFLQEYSKEIFKYKTHEEFFKAEIRKIKKEAEKLLRKVTGVFALTPDDIHEPKKKSNIPFIIGESVQEWKTWQKEIRKSVYRNRNRKSL